MAFDTVVDRTKLEASITATADAIRDKTGNTGKINWDENTGFADAIAGLSVEELIQHADIPDYVKGEALRVAQQVQSVREDDSIVFLAMSDNHHYGEQANADRYPDANGIQTNESNLHAAMAAKILAYGLKFDFMAQLGDATWGSEPTTIDLLHAQADELLSFLREAHKDIPCFHAIGNHDTNIYRFNHAINNSMNNPSAELATGEWLYNNFTALSASDNTVFGGQANGGYCYRDFPDKKLRVFLLNTSEALTATQNDRATLGSQRKWFADALVNLNNKSDAAAWSFMVLSHYPADYGGTMPLSELLRAYVEGSSIAIALESGSNTTVSFAGKNAAKIIAQFHGHVHNFITSKLYSYASGKGVQYDAWRMCIPNGQFNRENYYTTVGNYTDVNFSEAVSYSKTPKSAMDTSFVVNVINPSEQVIHSICYGAGRDRTISYGATVYYTIQSVLSNVSLSNTAGSIEKGKPFAAMVIPDTHCAITSVKVTMGGADVTSTVYHNGVIDIAEVTGNLVITASAQIALACTNQIPISTDANGSVYNGVGYKSGVYIQNGVDSSATGHCATGYIPIKHGDVIRMKDMNFTRGQANHRIVFYNSSYGFIGQMAANGTYLMDTTLKGVMDSNNNYVQFTIATSHAQSTNAAYIRICCANITSASILTVNEEIKYVDELETSYAVINSLTNAVNSNTATSVAGGANYTATISARDGYELRSVLVEMGGADITSMVYSNGQVNIPVVTGSISITATAIKSATYTNQIPISTDASGAIYNGTGIRSGYRLDSSGNDSTGSGSFVTGFIPVKAGDVVYLKNVSYEKVASGSLTLSNQRICFYDANKTFLGLVNAASTGVQNRIYDGDILIQFTVKSLSNCDVTNAAYFRINAAYIGEDSVITVNEPIE